MQPDDQNPLSKIGTLLEVTKANVDACIASIEHKEVIDEALVETRMHYIRFDGNGSPMIKMLAEYMYQHVIDYCISSRSRPDKLTSKESARITKEARNLFVHPPATPDDPDQTGEAGELLLYMLMEAVLLAPQVVAKMELKTNAKLEINGSDGIHMAWNEADQIVDIFFGESKIYQNLGSAVKAALKSIEKFHDDEMCRHEFLMVTKQFKHANHHIQKAVASLLSDGVPSSEVRINHACLIGFNWNEYENIFKEKSADRLETLKKRYQLDAARIHSAWRDRIGEFKYKDLRLTVFFLPFERVQDFRDEFNKALD